MKQQNNPQMGEWFARLKEIDLHDLADRLGMQRHGKQGNYFSPARKETQASLSIYPAKGTRAAGWKDHTSGDQWQHHRLGDLSA
ncbi:hypothetical protein [Paludibacterium denitrificans]|uniref:hypothetical protein n=1 Tax=Paludibacterium denitrificans TaxID=2675226 RepID=UPI001E3AE5A3|nr:hypothetical protein [Paludibacterium denitrificans]